MENKIMQNEEAIAVVEEIAKTEPNKWLKAGGMVAGVALAGIVLYKGGKAIYTKVKAKKEQADAEAEQQDYAEADLA